MRGLASGFGQLQSVSVGGGFTFGHKRSGDVALLNRLGVELHYHVDEVVPVAAEAQIISSTRIREAIREGNLGLAASMMGRPYAIEGLVEHGDQIGRRHTDTLGR